MEQQTQSNQKKKQQNFQIKKPEITHGCLYVRKSDVWAIDYQTSPEFVQVYAKESIFKVKKENLYFLEEQE